MVFQSDKWSIINTIAGTVSALAALITVLVTAWTLKHAREDKKAEDEARRPEFEMFGVIRSLEEVDGHVLDVFFQNRGINPAKDVLVKIALIGPTRQDNEVYRFEKDIVGLVQPTSSFAVTEEFKLENEGSPHPLIVTLSYTDARTKTRHVQEIVKQWVGFTDLVEAGFQDISRNELQKVRQSGLLTP